jgi:hypothetical protein
MDLPMMEERAKMLSAAVVCNPEFVQLSISLAASAHMTTKSILWTDQLHHVIQRQIYLYMASFHIYQIIYQSEERQVMSHEVKESCEPECSKPYQCYFTREA